jgi:glutamine synthetase
MTTAPGPQVLDDARRAALADRARDLRPGLAEKGVQGVIGAWVDNAGIARIKSVPLSRLESAASGGIGMSPVFDAFGIDDSIAATPAGGPLGDLRLHPDPERLVPLTAQPGWAWAPVDRWTQDGTPHPQCSRLLLRRITDRLAGDGLSFLAAVEVEWIVGLLPAPAVAGGRPATTATDDFVPAVSGAAYGAARMIECSDYLADVLAGLADAGVAVEQIHPEYATGQFEVSVAPEDPVGAADTSVLVRHIVRATAARHGLRVSFAPKVLAGDAGNGGHVHVSAWRDGVNLFAADAPPTPELPDGAPLGGEAAQFAAGILHRLPALLTLGAPGVASYLRLIPSHWAGAFAAWGVENREAALRLVRGAPGVRAHAANLEIKCFDLAANPYLALAGLLAAGAAGLREQAVLAPPVSADPASVAPADRAAAGIAALPSTLREATAAFLADDLFTHVFGPELVTTIAAVRQAEIETLSGLTEHEVVTATRWRY